ncbi:tyrosine-type recombinase/integrase [Candidatus Poribacteria bacterium]|nr:tyrosine-type recombinase/integrase [Candidatus Poribacteria bacterium]
MKGTRPLNNAEIQAVANSFEGTFAIRNRALFMIGVSIGGRIDELLSLKVNDVWQNGKPVPDVLYDKAIVKGGEVARAVPLNADGRQAVEEIIAWHIEKFGAFGEVNPDAPLFVSRVKNTDGTPKRMTTQAGSDAIMAAFAKAGLNGKLGTHSMRKSFAQRLYSQTNDIFVVQEMLGHKNVATTQKYLGVNYAEVREALELMSVLIAGTAPRQATPVHRATDSDLIAELAKRGYDVTTTTKGHA